MAANAIELSVIIPTFNELENIPLVLDVLKKNLSGIPYETIFVDDNSPDMTWKYIEELKDADVKVIRRIGRKGLSTAVVEGLSAAGGNYFLVMDADLQHDAAIIPKMLEAAQRGNDIVIGSRYMKGGSAGDWTLARKFISWSATVLTRFCTKVSVSDPMSGFFIVNAQHMRRIIGKLKPSGYKILLDILVNSTGASVSEVPYTFNPRLKGKSKLGIGTIFDLLKYLLPFIFRRRG